MYAAAHRTSHGTRAQVEGPSLCAPGISFQASLHGLEATHDEMKCPRREKLVDGVIFFISHRSVCATESITGASSRRCYRKHTLVLGSNVHDDVFDAVQLAPDAPSPRNQSTVIFSIVRVVSRDDTVKSKTPVLPVSKIPRGVQRAALESYLCSRQT